MWGQREVSVALLPQHGITRLDAVDGVDEYLARGVDPQFTTADPSVVRRIRPGWWRIRWTLRQRDGWVLTPMIYFDYGRGFSEADAVMLNEPDAEGVSDTVVHVRARVRSLRMDPTVRDARFVSDAIHMTRLGRVEAARRMLEGVASHEYGSVEQAEALRKRLVPHLLVPLRMQGRTGLWNAYLHAGALRCRSYALWHRLYTPMVAHLRPRASALEPGGPAVAIVVDATGAGHDSLAAMLDSVQAQLWSRWTLHVGVPACLETSARALIDARASDDPRIVLHDADVPAWAQGVLMLVREPLLLHLAHDDVLAPHATCEFAHAAAAVPHAQVLYSDSDVLDAAGRRTDPRFKPAWNPVLFSEHDYIGTAWVARTQHLRARGMQDGLAAWLKIALDGLDLPAVMHVPKMLVHGTARSASLAGRARSSRQPVTDGPRVSVVIPTRDGLALLRTAVDGVRTGTAYANVDLVVVDNGSVEPETLEYLAALDAEPRCRVVRDDAPFNFSALVNLGVLSCGGEFICLLNNDIEVVDADWLGAMMAHAMQPGVGAVGAQLHYPDGTLQHGGILLGVGGVAGHAHHGAPCDTDGYMQRAVAAQELSAVTAACMVVRREAFEEVGGFDEGFPVAFNDVDFCLRLRQAGWRIVYTPHAQLCHHESVSRGKEDTTSKKARFDSEVQRMRERWLDVLLDDPAYNPNLSLDWSDFSPSFPPRGDLVGTHMPASWWQARPRR